MNCIQEDSDIRYNQYKGVGIIQYQKQRSYHSSQISSFIHSYCRISMIEQLLKFKNILFISNTVIIKSVNSFEEIQININNGGVAESG